MKKILFVTGVDTGVGKTVLTAVLLACLRQSGVNALGMKPFCSGARDDAQLLLSLQEGRLTLDEVNPFYFDRPLTPAAASGRGRRGVSLEAALEKIRALAGRCDFLLVEGVGGLLAPLGADYTVRDLIRRLRCQVVVVCPNRLGVINHTLLTAEALQNAGIKEFTVVMMGVRQPDLSAISNARIIQQWLPGRPVFCLPYLGFRASTPRAVKINVKYLQKTLARFFGAANLITFFRKRSG